MNPLLLCACALGEYSIDNCTACWPCEANHFCQAGIKTECRPGQWSPVGSGECRPCPPGMECGGAGVKACDFGTFSPGNQSACTRCSSCEDQVTVRRCNSTHDSMCEQLTMALAIITIHQEFRTTIHAELFGMFVMIYASALPRARVVQVCGGNRCVDCFQGLCANVRTLQGPMYRTQIEIQFDAKILEPNLEALTRSAYLLETAKDTMSKLTDAPFIAYSRVEHRILCPGHRTVWDGSRCREHRIIEQEADSARTWVGLVVGILILLAMVVSGRKPQWTPVAAVDDLVRED